jgi:hypothetical protein
MPVRTIVGSAFEAPPDSTGWLALEVESQKLHLRIRVFVANSDWA